MGAGQSAWNARAAVVRCSGARVLRTPSHVKESFTAAIVVRSLWAALGEVCVAGLVLGEVVDRLVVCWPQSCDVVVAVDMCFLWMGVGYALASGVLSLFSFQREEAGPMP